jgi:Cys-tRNA(Pro) deacylase
VFTMQGVFSSVVINELVSNLDYPITPAVRFLREKKVEFVPRLYDYVEKGGTQESARALGVDEHAVVKTLVFETNEKKGLIVLMHGDREVSTKTLARLLGVKSVGPATPEKASKLTGYLVGGTSPFGTRILMPVYVEKSILPLEKIYINGGKRGFLIEIDPGVLKQTLNAEGVKVAIEK